MLPLCSVLLSSEKQRRDNGGSLNSTNDPDIIALKSGDEAAWSTAFRHFWSIALGAAQHSKAGLTRSEAEEVASEAIVDLIGRIEAVATFDHAKALLTVIASRKSISRARGNSAKKRQPPEDWDPLQLPPVFSNALTDVDRCEMIILL